MTPLANPRDIAIALESVSLTPNARALVLAAARGASDLPTRVRAATADDVAAARRTLDAAERLRIERDFNRDDVAPQSRAAAYLAGVASGLAGAAFFSTPFGVRNDAVRAAFYMGSDAGDSGATGIPTADDEARARAARGE